MKFSYRTIQFKISLILYILILLYYIVFITINQLRDNNNINRDHYLNNQSLFIYYVYNNRRFMTNVPTMMN